MISFAFEVEIGKEAVQLISGAENYSNEEIGTALSMMIHYMAFEADPDVNVQFLNVIAND